MTGGFQKVSLFGPHDLALGIWHAPMAAKQDADTTVTATTAPMQSFKMELICFYRSTGILVFVTVWLSIDPCSRNE